MKSGYEGKNQLLFHPFFLKDKKEYIQYRHIIVEQDSPTTSVFFYPGESYLCSLCESFKYMLDVKRCCCKPFRVCS